MGAALLCMSKPRTLNPNKKLLLAAVITNPGLSASQLVRLTGVPIWRVQKILPEFAGRRLIYYRIEPGDKFRIKRWYPIVADLLNRLDLAVFESYNETSPR